MKSPFPGMDPYLERRWSDVHTKLITYIGDTLQPLLPGHLRARTEERVLLETTDEHESLGTYRSDIAVVQGVRNRAPARAATNVVAIDPIFVDVYDAPEIDTFVQIVDITNGNRVITAIEILSPWNKAPGRLNRDYRRKLDDYARADVSLVEIDLLRSSRKRLAVGQDDLPAERRTPYLVCLRRAGRPSRWELYPIPLRQPLPTIPIPLREVEIALDLQPLIERAYVGGGHDDIDYRLPPDPPLTGEDATWADELLRAAGQR